MDDQRQAVARHGFTARATATKFREIRAGLTFGFLRQPTNAERQTRLWSAVTKMSSIFCFWRNADVARCPPLVRSWSPSRRAADYGRLPTLGPISEVRLATLCNA